MRKEAHELSSLRQRILELEDELCRINEEEHRLENASADLGSDGGSVYDEYDEAEDAYVVRMLELRVQQDMIEHRRLMLARERKEVEATLDKLYRLLDATTRSPFEEWADVGDKIAALHDRKLELKHVARRQRSHRKNSFILRDNEPWKWQMRSRKPECVYELSDEEGVKMRGFYYLVERRRPNHTVRVDRGAARAWLDFYVAWLAEQENAVHAARSDREEILRENAVWTESSGEPTSYDDELRIAWDELAALYDSEIWERDNEYFGAYGPESSPAEYAWECKLHNREFEDRVAALIFAFMPGKFCTACEYVAHTNHENCPECGQNYAANRKAILDSCTYCGYQNENCRCWDEYPDGDDYADLRRLGPEDEDGCLV